MVRQRKFPEAIELLNDALDKDASFVEAHLRLAFIYDLLRELKQQQYHLEKVVELAPSNPRLKNIYFSLAGVYYNLGQYQRSSEQLSTLQRMDIDNARMLEEYNRLKANVDFALGHIDKPLNIRPVPMPEVLNTFALQYFPVLNADEEEIFFTRRTGFSFHDDEDIYYSSKDEDGQWLPPVSLSPNINSQYNEGTSSISADGRTLIFTTCEGRQSYGSCDLYITMKQGDDWSVPENLGPGINTRAWESQPSLSADGRELYFISDRAGGFGKRDIWMSRLSDDGTWQQAWNLGPKVNTADDEVSPFIHVNGISLFFSSKGYPGFGGFDIYETERRGGGWKEPVNIGYPINNHEDQVSLFISTDGRTGYYSYEEKIGGGKTKSLLYSFQFPEDAILVPKSDYVKGKVLDKETELPLEARIELHDVQRDTLLSVFSSDATTGEYYAILNRDGQYALYVEKQGYLFESRTFSDGEESSPKVIDFYLQPIKAGLTTRLNNIFFDTDQYALRQESKTELNKVVGFLKMNPEIRVEIAGHTDDQGTEAYNKELSERRAESVYQYLIDSGIRSEQVRYRGYGESQPLADNATEQGRQQNRRIEFRVLQ